LKLVEAGGIEPPSRDISARASTCVVYLLAGDALPVLALVSSDKQDFTSASSAKVSPSVRQGMTLGQPANSRLHRSHRQDREDVAVYAAMRRLVLALVSAVRCFTRPPDNLDTRPGRTIARSIPGRPHCQRTIYAQYITTRAVCIERRAQKCGVGIQEWKGVSWGRWEKGKRGREIQNAD
jgi:hypothetical protein